MRRLIALASGLLVCGMALAGCGNNENKDTGSASPPAQPPMSSSTDKMAAGSDKMSAGSGDAVKDKVDAALKADTALAGASITVDHKDGKIILKGEVADNAAKKQAGEAAGKAAKDAGSTDKLQNMLTVKSH